MAVLAAGPLSGADPAAPSSDRADPPVAWARCLDQPPAWYRSREAVRVAESVLLYQRASGGWPKDVDMARPLGAGDRDRILARRGEGDSTIDNGATYTQIRYLARVAAAGGLERFRSSIERGLAFLLAAQHPSGGWPQYYPLRADYSRHVTFNDGAMIGVMRLLRDVAGGDPAFAFLDAAARASAAGAVGRGLRFVLDAQVRVDGRLTAWCAQHDEVTLEPRGARRYEPASLSGKESVEIVEYLMEVAGPDPEVVRSVEAAVAWLSSVRIEGLRIERVGAAGTVSGPDVVVTGDPGAPPLWARFYEIGSNRPLFVGRDGVVRYALSEIERERRANYSWLGPYAADLLERRYPAWRAASAGE